MRRTTTAVMVSSVHSAPPVFSIEVTTRPAGHSKRVSDSGLEMWLWGVEARTDRGATRARASCKHGTIAIIVCVVVTLPVKSATTFMMSIRAVIIRTLPAVRGPVKRKERLQDRERLGVILAEKTT